MFILFRLLCTVHSSGLYKSHNVRWPQNSFFMIFLSWKIVLGIIFQLRNLRSLSLSSILDRHGSLLLPCLFVRLVIKRIHLIFCGFFKTSSLWRAQQVFSGLLLLGDMNICRWGAAVGALGPFLYICGGSDDASRLETVERFDPFSNVWVPSVPMSSSRNGVGVTAGNGRIYAIGGFYRGIKVDLLQLVPVVRRLDDAFH